VLKILEFLKKIEDLIFKGYVTSYEKFFNFFEIPHFDGFELYLSAISENLETLFYEGTIDLKEKIINIT